MKTLVIVESPNKVKKISDYLGGGYQVVASVGHIRDLPSKTLGVAPPNFVPEYEPTERGAQIIARLKSQVSRADRVLLATDPDREGEAIAWHLAQALKLKNPERVTFAAITEESIKKGIQDVRGIDMGRVRSQEARRVVDRIVGYRVSEALSDQSGENLTGGRVQSPAVRLVVEREREIEAFRSVEHYGAELEFSAPNGAVWKAKWDTKPNLPEGADYILDKSLAVAVAGLRDVLVVDFADSERRRGPYAPFTTSSLQQAASSRLKFKPQKTMDLAQALFGQGAITYHRTDAPNMDEEGAASIAKYATECGLPLAAKPRKWKAKEGAQEGHEAIRPTHIEEKERGENEDEKALYALIWQRALASQLEDAGYAVRSCVLEGSAQGQKIRFVATGSVLKSHGWLDVYSEDEDDKKDQTSDNPIPFLSVQQKISAASGKITTPRTKAPSRYTEASLIRELENQGIGRPSTYAAIMENISERGYIAEAKTRFLKPTSIGCKIVDALVGRFSFIEIPYTRDLEDRLDAISEGRGDYEAVVGASWETLDKELSSLSSVEIPPEYPCPTCGKAMVRRKGSNGFFWACTGYPECKTTLPDARGKPGQKKVSAQPKPSGIACPKCGKDLVRRTGTSKPKEKGKKGAPYDFYGCSGYPSCKATYKTGQDGKPILG
ncbi:type I DNA topoisomerase [Acetobacter persici]|uniref:type I DNA topoisomerase n=1 Tax=Acetobacter persici TaxID=1076596 RepID=UPI001BA857A5|nr:type I DNA topoisomerase [Acetobacter persici]MBS1017093.1 type I DNA topoisomerase [Acetobacter persici]